MIDAVDTNLKLKPLFNDAYLSSFLVTFLIFFFHNIINIRQICINVYNQLSKYNIKGIEKKQFITNTFDLHINSLYNWIKKDTKIEDNNKYLNTKIDFIIENFFYNILF